MPYIHIKKNKGKKNKIEYITVQLSSKVRDYHINCNNNQIDFFVILEHNIFAIPEGK